MNNFFYCHFLIIFVFLKGRGICHYLASSMVAYTPTHPPQTLKIQVIEICEKDYVNSVSLYCIDNNWV